MYLILIGSSGAIAKNGIDVCADVFESYYTTDLHRVKEAIAKGRRVFRLDPMKEVTNVNATYIITEKGDETVSTCC
jgi:hypothetical protein